MPANIAPQFINSANAPSVAVTAANTSSEGGGTVGTNIFLLFTAGVNDSVVEQVLAMPTGTTPTTTTPTVARLFLSSVGTGTTTSANTFLISEIVLPAVGADSASVANNPIAFAISNIRVPTGFFLLVTNHAAPAANTQWVFTALGGNY